jgi:hypothetical protein
MVPANPVVGIIAESSPNPVQRRCNRSGIGTNTNGQDILDRQVPRDDQPRQTRCVHLALTYQGALAGFGHGAERDIRLVEGV